MKVKCKAYGRLEEELGSNTIELVLKEGNVDALKQEVNKRYGNKLKSQYQIAINKELNKEQIKEGDEIALLPPFAGG